MRDEEEVLELGRPRLPRPVRLGALVVAGLTLIAAVAIRLQSHPKTSPVAAEARWPQQRGACGDDVELPIVSSTQRDRNTGITAIVGGSTVSVVDFDGGRSSALPGAELSRGGYATDVAAESGTFAVAHNCAATDPPPTSRLIRVDAAGHHSSELLPGSVSTIFVDRGRVWGIGFPSISHPYGSLLSLDVLRRVRLPSGFAPAAVTDGVAVGTLIATPRGAGDIVLVQPDSGRVLADLGQGQLLAAGHGVVVWTVGCWIDSKQPCLAHQRTISGGATSTYRLPRPIGFARGRVSPDGRSVAFTLERGSQDPRYLLGYPVPPADVAVLHLDSAALDIVPGVELPAKPAPGLAFSSDGRWLVIAVSAGARTRLLAWRPGLAHPLETSPVASASLGTPAVVVR